MFRAIYSATLLALSFSASAMSATEVEHSKKLYQEAIKPVMACSQQLTEDAKAELAVNCYIEDLYVLVKKGNYMAAIIIADSFDAIGDHEQANAWHAYLLKSEQVPADIKDELKKSSN